MSISQGVIDPDDERPIDDRFKDFFENFTIDGEKKYLRKIKDLVDTKDIGYLVVDCSDLSAETSLALKVVEDPIVSVNGAEKAVRDIITERRDEEKDVSVRFKNLPTEKTQIREIGSEHLNRMIELEAVLTRTSPVKPYGDEITFTCGECGNDMDKSQKPWQKLQKPKKCDRMDCGARKSKIYINPDELDDLQDRQIVKIQEKPEKVGTNPRWKHGFILGDLVEDCSAGDRVRLTAIVRPKIPRGRDADPVFEAVLRVNYIEPLNKEADEIEINDKERERIEELASDDDVMQKLRDSIAPAIYGHENVKEAIALTLFGADRKKAGGSELRGNSNILLIGDPSTGKSVILKYAGKIAPRGLYTSGKSSTGVGLTAAAVKDDITESWTLEAGALVLADKGVCAVDEFDKMSNKDRDSIHEAMEQGSVNVSKAGITASLNARTSVIAGANPKHGRFDSFKPVADQVNLDPALVSRFDLIFKITDDPDHERDAKVAEHMAKSRYKNLRDSEDEIEPVIDPDLLRKYIAYARRLDDLELSEDALNVCLEFYLKLRDSQKHETEEDSAVAIATRHFESLLRLSESYARIRLDTEIKEQDAERAKILLKDVLEEMGVDPETGELDVDSWLTGEPKSQRDKIKELEQIIKDLAEESDDGKANVKSILSEVNDLGIEKDYARSLLDKMKDNGDVLELEPGKYKLPY